MNRQNDEAAEGKVPFLSVLAYGMGDVGCNFSWMFVGLFLMKFYTDVFEIGMASVSLLFIVSRIWDAVNDPLIGLCSDRTRTRWGRYRPWLLFGAPLTALVLILTFWAHPDWPHWAKIAYMYVTYCTLVLGYTCVNLPYGTLCGAMTQNMTERAKINTSRSVSAMVAIGVITIITLPLVEFFGRSAPANGYLFTAALYGGIFAACHLLCFRFTKEVVAQERREKYPLSVNLRSVLRNRPYLLALLGQFLFGFVLYGRNAGAIYYFQYVEGNEGLFVRYALSIIIPSIVGAATFPFVFARTHNKGRAAAIFAFWTGICMAAIFLFSPVKSPVGFYVCSALSMFFFSGFNTAIYAIIPDCVEYGEWKTGIRNDGFQYAFISLGNKIGMALGTALLAAVLAHCGYVANEAQNPAVLAVMKHSFTTVPGFLWLLTAGALLFYRLDRTAYNRIVDEIKGRPRKEKSA